MAIIMKIILLGLTEKFQAEQERWKMESKIQDLNHQINMLKISIEYCQKKYNH